MGHLSSRPSQLLFTLAKAAIDVAVVIRPPPSVAATLPVAATPPLSRATETLAAIVMAIVAV